MKINNKRRNLLKYRYCRRFTSEPQFFYADDKYFFILIDDRRRKANCIKQKLGISQRWGLMVRVKETENSEFYKWARTKGSFLAYFHDELANKPFPLAESERKR